MIPARADYVPSRVASSQAPPPFAPVAAAVRVAAEDRDAAEHRKADDLASRTAAVKVRPAPRAQCTPSEQRRSRGSIDPFRCSASRYRAFLVVAQHVAQQGMFIEACAGGLSPSQDEDDSEEDEDLEELDFGAS